MLRPFFFALICSLLGFSMPGQAEQSLPFGNGSVSPPKQKITYMVLSCNDGDTCKVRSEDNITISVRLIGIDAPEYGRSSKKNSKKKKAQPYAQESKNFINTFIQGKSVTLKSYGTDHFSRNLAEIFKDGVNVNLKLVEEGFAEVYQGKTEPSFQKKMYLKAQEQAQKQKKGIWSLEKYESPAHFRKRSKN